MEITIFGIIVLICIFVQMIIGAYSIPKWQGEKLLWIAAGVVGCSTISSMLVISFLLLRPERERNIEIKGYKKGVEQKYMMRIDTIWIPKK